MDGGLVQRPLWQGDPLEVYSLWRAPARARHRRVSPSPRGGRLIAIFPLQWASVNDIASNVAIQLVTRDGTKHITWVLDNFSYVKVLPKLLYIIIYKLQSFKKKKTNY